jgi:hypothetical protein
MSKSKLCYDWQSVSQSVLVSSPHQGPKTRFLLLSDSCGFVDVRRPLWREDASVVYNCCWSSPAQSFLGPSSAGLITTFSCHRIDTPNLEGEVPRKRIRITLRLAIYRQSVRLGVKPLRPTTRDFFQLHSCGNSPYVTSSLTRRWICFLWICLAFRQM